MNLVEIESGDSRAVIDVSRGGEILSLFDGRIGGEVFWRDEDDSANLATVGIDQNTQSFYDNYRGGAQELFPNTADATNVLGAELPFHGELTITAMQVVRKTPSELFLSCRLRRFPVTVEKSISLTESGSLKVASSVTNLSSRRIPYTWGFHPVFSDYFIGEDSTLVVPASQITSHPQPFGRAQQYPPGTVVPREENAEGFVTLELVPPRAETADLLYIELNEPWFVVGRPGKRSIELKWDSQDFRCLWLWQECHDQADWPWWGRHHIVGIEPHTSFPAQSLERHVQSGSCNFLEPYSSNSVTFEMNLVASSDSD